MLRPGSVVTRASHVFVVGLPRTGTTLTRNVLNRSPLVGLGGESHFFGSRGRLGLTGRTGYRERFARLGDLRTEEGLRRIVDAIFASSGKSYWARLARTADRAEFERLLRASDRTERALFDTAMAVVAAGKPIRGEKTPHHIEVVPTLLEWFPEARVVHTFRDPRAVYVSLRRKERAEALSPLGRAARRLGPAFDAYSIVNVGLAWRRVAALHRAYAARYPGRYLLVRFEDLVTAPEPTIRRICEFVGIEFVPEMLDQTVFNSSYLPRDGASGFDRSAVRRWERHLGPLGRRAFRLLCGAELHAFGYPD